MEYGEKTVDAFKQAFTTFDDKKIFEGKWPVVIRLCIATLFVGLLLLFLGWSA